MHRYIQPPYFKKLTIWGCKILEDYEEKDNNDKNKVIPTKQKYTKKIKKGKY